MKRHGLSRRERLIRRGDFEATYRERKSAADDRLDWETPLERPDALLAAMPTQVVRGDGVRDSHLGEIETMLDFGEHPVKLRHTGLSEIQLLFRLTGFEITQMYGDDEDMRPFTGGPDNDYTIIAERR